MKVLSVDYRDSDSPEAFCRSLKETGFAVLTNHPISPQLIENTYARWRDFFKNTEAAKKEYLFTREAQDGYFPFKSENAKGHKIGDLKEFFHIYQWGRIPPEARETSLQLFNELQNLASELLQWVNDHLPKNIQENLSIPLKDMITNSDKTLLRVLHYPPMTAEVEKDAVRAAPHEDINLITLLPAATAPGLEVLDTKGNWHQVTCDPGNVVVNVGDMLQMCTERYYKSTTHRVINPHQGLKNESRYSMPLFLHPRKDVRLSKTHTAIEYLHERLREIGVY